MKHNIINSDSNDGGDTISNHDTDRHDIFDQWKMCMDVFKIYI